jgi:predicted nuclease of predicted toxin-antitoxin system
MHASTDEVVLERARDEERVLVSADSDFGTILARTKGVLRGDEVS